MKHPVQPAEMVNGVLRFKENPIVNFLLDFATERGTGLNEISIMVQEDECDFTRNDYEQLMQLIGYSLSGAPGSVSDATLEIAHKMMEEGVTEKDAYIEYLETELKTLKEGIRGPIAALFKVHPEDLRIKP